MRNLYAPVLTNTATDEIKPNANVDAEEEEETIGLGLSVARALCHALGGEIFIESQEGFGTTVSFSIFMSKNLGSILMTDLRK